MLKTMQQESSDTTFLLWCILITVKRMSKQRSSDDVMCFDSLSDDDEVSDDRGVAVCLTDTVSSFPFTASCIDA